MQQAPRPKAKERFLRTISPAEHIDLRKISHWLTFYRILQAVVAVVLLVLYFFGHSPNVLLALGIIVPVVLMENALLSSTTARLAMYEEQETQMQAVLDSEQALIRQLRTQRHDFINHLQVVYALIQMKDYDKAEEYVEQIYTDIQSVGKQMRTQCAAVNALLAAKSVQAEKRGIRLAMAIHTDLAELPIREWEVCRILANLLDNAMDASEGAADPVVELALREDVTGLRVEVSNNGKPIPQALLEDIFQPGFTTKGERGTGMGLYIVRSTVEEHGGTVDVTSDETRTVFRLHLPPQKWPAGGSVTADDS